MEEHPNFRSHPPASNSKSSKNNEMIKCDCCLKRDENVEICFNRGCAPKIWTCKNCSLTFGRLLEKWHKEKWPTNNCQQIPLRADGGEYYFKFEGRHKKTIEECCIWTHFIKKGFREEFVPMRRPKRINNGIDVNTDGTMMNKVNLSKNCYSTGFQCEYPKSADADKMCVCQRRFARNDQENFLDIVHHFSNYLCVRAEEKGFSMAEWIEKTSPVSLCLADRLFRPIDMLFFLEKSTLFVEVSREQLEHGQKAVVVCSAKENDFGEKSCLVFYFGSDTENETGNTTYPGRTHRRYFCWADEVKQQRKPEQVVATVREDNGAMMPKAKRSRRQNEQRKNGEKGIIKFVSERSIPVVDWSSFRLQIAINTLILFFIFSSFLQQQSPFDNTAADELHYEVNHAKLKMMRKGRQKILRLFNN